MYKYNLNTMKIFSRIRRVLCRSRAKFCVKLVVFILLVLVSLTALGIFDEVFPCSNSTSVDTINKLCVAFQENAVSGDLCSKLCGPQPKIHFVSCVNHRNAGKDAFMMQWGERSLMLKAERNRANVSPKSLDEIRTKMTQLISEHIPYNPDFLEDILGVDGEGKQLDKSLGSLLTQHEFMVYRAYKDSPFFPTIHGTCGRFYAVDNVPPGPVLSPSVSEMARVSARRPWQERARVALGLIDLVAFFDGGLHETLHMCDMKGANFGVTEPGTVQAIDADMAIFDGRLRVRLSSPRCQTHSDCDYFDCRGWCDIPRRTCSTIRLNNNFQALCENILSGTSLTAYRGVLDNPPLEHSKALADVLHRCAYPPAARELLPGCEDRGIIMRCEETNKYRLRHRTSSRVVGELRTFLEASLGSGG